MDNHSFIIVIPTLNEEASIGSVIDELIASGIPSNRIVVIDGGSTDRTVDVATSKGVRVIPQEGRGKTDAIRTAARNIPSNVECVVFMDGDGTYPGRYAKDLISMCANGYDLVIGARKYFEKGSQGAVYRFGNTILSKVFSLLFGTTISDALSGMYAIKAGILRELQFESRGFGIESELLAHATSMGYRVGEIPIEYRRRIDPKAKKLRVYHGIDIFIDMVRLAWRYNPVFFIFAVTSLILIPGLVLGLYVAYHYFFTGIKYYVKGLIAVFMTLAGLQAFMLALISIYLKRMELRMRRLIKETVGRAR